MQTATITPLLLRNSVGFDRFNDLFETMLDSGKTNEATYPPYNIEKLEDNQYRITMAVAGFKSEELDIITHEDQLIVSGNTESREEVDNAEYLYKGIATRNFQRKFSLTDYMKVVGANIADGLLTIDLEREVPEARKPRAIDIVNGRPEQKAIEHKKSKKKKN